MIRKCLTLGLVLSFAVNGHASEAVTSIGKAYEAKAFREALIHTVSNFKKLAIKEAGSGNNPNIWPGLAQKIENKSCRAEVIGESDVLFRCDSESVKVTFFPGKKAFEVKGRVFSFAQASSPEFKEKLEKFLSGSEVGFSNRILNAVFVPSAHAEVVVGIIFAIAGIGWLIDGLMYHFGGDDCDSKGKDGIEIGEGLFEQCQKDKNEVMSTSVKKEDTKTYQAVRDLLGAPKADFSCELAIKKHFKECAENKDFLKLKEELCLSFAQADACLNEFVALEDSGIFDGESEKKADGDSSQNVDASASGQEAVQE